MLYPLEYIVLIVLNTVGVHVHGSSCVMWNLRFWWLLVVCRQAPKVQRNILPMPSSLLKVEAAGVNKLMILIVKLHCIRSQNT